MRTNFILFGCLLFCLIPASVYAEKIELTSGKIIEGKIVERSSDYIKVDVGEGLILPFYLKYVKRISPEVENKTASDTALAPSLGDDKDKVAFKEKLDAWRSNYSENAKKNLTSATNMFRNKGVDAFATEEFATIYPKLQEWENLNKTHVQGFDAFAQEFPGNRFAADAHFLALFLGLDYADSKEVRALMVDNLKKFLIERPGWQLNDWTCENLKIDGSWPPVCAVPKVDLETYIEAVGAAKNFNFSVAAEKFTVLKDNMDFSRDIDGGLATEVYTWLVSSSEVAKKREQTLIIIKEGLKKFPQNSKLNALAQKMIKENNLPQDYFTKP